MKKIFLSLIISGTIFLTFFTVEINAPELDAQELIIDQNIIDETDKDDIIELSEEEIMFNEYELKSKYINDIENKEEKIIAYKSLMEEYKEYIEPQIQIYDIYSNEELNAIFSTVETEVFECGFNEKCNIASVIFNRLKSEKWGSTLQEVCYFPNQFSNWRTDISEDTILACEYVFLFGDTAQECLYFQSSEYMETFCGAEYIFQDEAIHYFYR